jgi:hypothetical protein
MAKKKRKAAAVKKSRPKAKSKAKVAAKRKTSTPRRAPTAQRASRPAAAKRRAPNKSSAPPKRAAVQVAADLDKVFTELKDMLSEYASALRVQADKAGTYYLNTLRDDMAGKPHFFGGARKGKNYVSLYLMPVYEFADLLSSVPADLQQRMQGKSCFNFRTLAEIPREELKRLIDAAVARAKQAMPSAA